MLGNNGAPDGTLHFDFRYLAEMCGDSRLVSVADVSGRKVKFHSVFVHDIVTFTGKNLKFLTNVLISLV